MKNDFAVDLYRTAAIYWTHDGNLYGAKLPAKDEVLIDRGGWNGSRINVRGNVIWWTNDDDLYFAELSVVPGGVRKDSVRLVDQGGWGDTSFAFIPGALLWTKNENLYLATTVLNDNGDHELGESK